MTLTSASAFPEREGVTEVDVQGRQERRDVIDAQGNVVLTDVEKRLHFVAYLVRAGDAWVISELKVVQ